MKFTKSVFFVFLLMAQFTFGQKDTTEFEEVVDSVYFEEKPNYVGVNITPFFTSIMGRQNNDIKAFLVYKRNRGDKNLRVSVNYSSISNKSRYNYYNVIASTDTSYTARFYTDNYKNFDVRFGFEEMKGYQYSRLHIGADVLLGAGNYEYNYYVNRFQLDSSNLYNLNPETVLEEGKISGTYFNMGITVSFGFDWFISEDFLFTFQLTPQFTYHLLSNYKLEDNYGIYSSLNNFTDFKLGYFDVMMLYRF